MPLFLRFFHSVRPAMMPDRIVCNSPKRRWASEGGAHGEGLNNSQYSRMCDASTPSVLLRPNLVRTKSRIWAGLMMLTTWYGRPHTTHTRCRDYNARWIPDRREPVGSFGQSANPGDGATHQVNS